MYGHPLRKRAAALIMSLGVILFLIALVHHGNEASTLNELLGPVVAFVLDGLPALALVYAGYRLAQSDLSLDDRWRVWVWCLVGATLFVVIMGLSMLVRAFEGRQLGEALFPLLLAAEAGAIAGIIGGYQAVRARTEARRARRVSDALGFVNSLIRHDLRNDLTVIQSHAELLDEAAPDAAATETTADSVSVIAEKTDEALSRIDTTETVANTMIGDPDLEPVDLAAIAAEIASRVESSYDVPVTTALPDEAPVTANAGLRPVVDNLLENAVEHNDAEEPQVQVDIDASAQTFQLAVADNGPGVSDPQKKRLFDPEAGNIANGGLSLVQTLVEAYGGEVWVEDNTPRGSVFVVELPRADV